MIAIHLPVVEIREMLAEDKFVAKNKQEKVSAAEAVYVAVVKFSEGFLYPFISLVFGKEFNTCFKVLDFLVADWASIPSWSM